jgi:hypothetical protein
LFASSNNNNNINKKQSMFSQPAFTSSSTSTTAPPTTSPPRYGRQGQILRQPSFKGDSSIGSLHQQRIQTAGRVGTKRFVNPCKIFIGNLGFELDEAALDEFLVSQLGVPAALLIYRRNIVRDWKTNQSKGYAFVEFSEAHYGTLAIDKLHNQMLGDRRIVVRQGMRQAPDTVLMVKKQRATALTDEERAIKRGLQEAEAEDDEEFLDPEAARALRQLDPDLLPDSMKAEVAAAALVDAEGNEPIDLDTMNRVKRREIAKRNKKKKKKGTGFG